MDFVYISYQVNALVWEKYNESTLWTLYVFTEWSFSKSVCLHGMGQRPICKQSSTIFNAEKAVVLYHQLKDPETLILTNQMSDSIALAKLKCTSYKKSLSTY